AVGEGSGGAPALDPLGQRVVGALLWDQGVVDRRAAALLVVAVEDLLAGECADDLLDVGRFARGQRRVGGLPHVGGDDEGVHGGGDVGERIGGAVGQEVDDEGVGRRRQPDVGATVRVEVAAHRERGGGGGPGPRGDVGELREQVDPRAAVGACGDVQPARVRVRFGAEALPGGARRQVHAQDVGAPAQQ